MRGPYPSLAVDGEFMIIGDQLSCNIDVTRRDVISGVTRRAVKSRVARTFKDKE